ncbi:hypothetical protein Vretimale_7421 [Volvox reticuliferus]|uniref:Uncharacterized protein n=1 Tax=Volvox reticuliferus TaxID=1737510 RepID=A0A8J4FIU1_9CHLO|nr:hypothetical protein Vretifemale_7567 [Volvox reticuliferus]GIM02665.1 hypothetical protein Vretimale_7421 [Volvox reticuliferus]
MQTLSGGLGRRWRQTDATVDVESLGGVSVSSSIERQTMREQLDAVRQTLNTLSSQAQPNATGVNAAPAGLENALNEIAAKLSSIEGLYTNLTNKLEKVDLRVEDSERHIKELQHLSASAINETARLVDYVGGRSTPNVRSSQAGAGPSGVSTGIGLRARNMAASGVPTTPPPHGMSPTRSTASALDYVPAHLTSAVQQHAAQIHKVIAGLDFLEAHIIRQDQMVEALQKQVLTVARDVASTSASAEGRSSPNELSLRVHDMSELLNKLRAHMYKVEKKTSNNDQAVTLLTQRLQAVEQISGRQQHHRESRESASGQAAPVAGPSLLELVTAQEELRGMVQDLCRDVLDLRDQLQAQQQAQAQQPSEPSKEPPARMSAEEGAEVRRQLSYLMSQVPDLVAENKELKEFAARASKQIDDISGELEKQKRKQQEHEQQLQQQLLLRAAPAEGTPAEGPVVELKATVAELQQQLSSFEGRLQSAGARADLAPLPSVLQAIESSVAAIAELGSSLAVVQADVAGLHDLVVVLRDGLSERSKEAAASRSEVEVLSAAVQALTEAQSCSAAQQQQQPAEDVTTKLHRITEGSPEAAVLAAQVAASAKADLEEQFGQLRQRVEAAATAAEAAEAAARSSAELASAASEAFEAAGQADKAAFTALQTTVLAVVADLEQQQSTLKQQLAQLAAQVSEEQAAISSGLLQVQEQVAAAASAATEAATCAQAVQEQQAARGQQERESAEQLRAMQAELREQVASVMERLKERVEQSMQQMDTQLSAVSDRLSGVVTAQQLETGLEQLRTAAADALERYELAAVSLEEMRSELILLTGQQDVLQSRLQGVESVLGVESRIHPLVRATLSSTLPSTVVADAAQQDGEDAGPGPLQDGGRKGDFEGAAVLPVASGSPAGCGLLELVAKLKSRVGDLEGTLEVAASDMCQLRALMQDNVDRTQNTIQEVTAQLMSNLQDLSAVVDQRVANATADILAVEAASAALHQKVTYQEGLTVELATRIDGMQLRLENEVIARIHETSSTVSLLSARIAHDYVSREQLGAIFKARDNMKRAVDELASVFSTGRLMRTESVDDDAANAAEPEASGAQPSSSGPLSPRLVSALEDLAGKQAELEHQVQLALYRTEGSVRQEQLANIQQAMLTLELQFRRLGVSTQQAPVPLPTEAAKDLFDLRSRVEALEAAAVAPSSKAAAVTDAAAQLASAAGAAIEISSTPLPLGLASGSALRVLLTPEDPANGSSPIRVRVLVENCEAAGTPRLDVGCPDSPDHESSQEEEGGEPSLSSMLHGVQTGRSEESISAASSPEAMLAAAARSKLHDIYRALQDLSQQNDALRSEVVSEVAERQRLAEALADLQERLDLQVNATASTAAMVATMVTDQPQERVKLQVRVGATEAEADLAVLASTVSTLVARIGAAEEALASAFIVRTPRSPTRATAAADDDDTESAAAATQEGTDRPAEAEARQLGFDNTDEERRETEEGGSSEGLRPALGMMVPVLPHEIEQQLLELQSQLMALTGRVAGLEAVDALEEVRAVASEAVLDAIPGMVSQQVAALREEILILVGRQGEELLEMAGQAARDAAEAVLAVREAAAQAAAAQAAAEAAAIGARATSAEVSAETAAVVFTSGGRRDDEQTAASIRGLAAAAAQEAVQDVCLAAARKMVEETVRDVVVKALDEELTDVRGAVGSLTKRINDVDMLRDQLEVLAAQVRDPVTASTAVTGEPDPPTVGASNAQGPPSTPTAVAVASIFTPATTALVIPPARTPRGASPSAGGARPGAPLQQQSGGGSQQTTFLARLVEVVKRQSSRLHAQYSDAEETGMALAQVDHTLQEAEARLADVRDANSPAFAETLVTVLEQVAALRYIGSQTHPAVQQMVLEHENRLDKIAEDLKALSGGSPPRADIQAVAVAAAAQPHPALVEEIGMISQQIARIEAELARVAGQNTALDRAVKEMIVRLGSLPPSAPGSLAAVEDATVTDSCRVSTHEGEVVAEMESEGGEPAMDAGTDPSQAQASMGLAIHVRLVEGMLEAQLQGLRHELMGEIRARAGSGGGAATVTAATTAAELGELEKTVSKLHSAVTAIRNRLLAMQEYVDSTQGMIKDMHIALGGLVRRVDTLEATSGPGSRSARVSGCGSVSGGGADPGNLRELQSDLHKFERRLLTMESSSLDAAHALASLKGLTPRVTEVESRLLDACSKLAVALGGSPSSTAPVIPAVTQSTSLPAVAGMVRALERRLGSRLEAACGALDTLASALSAAGRIQAESTANPFKAISAAVNNPVIVAMEKKLETVRSEILAVATSLSEDMRRDHQQHQLESRLASADTSVGGGSAFRP